ncbi:diiron oxygenase [Mycobacteroides immunogenum]|uniref:AurF domain containing protein n=1 Tax=Mycobacteroides immunogenum TaxID=83262 RepID=A0A7V8LP48_9MYCO|nr:diiron oxygenase [Mycobacteroides immunogenum]AMT72799.1 AurF domain containing protein [Mycobacteroides immunogenum]ANO05962.1 AurF domain containing protein [Mycobacteroides immunogenum]KIU41276.1 AurF domain containing protein [Mycobacteroides immunogenum]KPG07832.1 AurF domain containing protein [Mycobacteroides immunogenum]KPG09529.1 AurF domain containing protein [Mycobacteroides immunogenum]
MTKHAAITDDDTDLMRLLDRLSEMSERDYYNPYRTFDWPAELPLDEYWMSPELLSVHNTVYEGQLSDAQLLALSRWESINFYSLNVHGIRELLIEIAARIHTRGFEPASEYLHHILGEENEHMWFFARFCTNYGQKIYDDKQMRFNNSGDPDAADFLVFARLWIFEEIVDYYNAKMATDKRLHTTVRQVNAIHHRDESRHIAFGRQIVGHLWTRLREELTTERLREIGDHLSTYMDVSAQSTVSPAAYRDTGLPEPYALRRNVLASDGWKEHKGNMLKRPTEYLTRIGCLESGANT